MLSAAPRQPAGPAPDRHALDARVGVSLPAATAQHGAGSDLLAHLPRSLSWIELYSENWLAASRLVSSQLEAIGERFELSLHGVGLSLATADGLDRVHLRRLRALIERCRPVLVSEHLSWGAALGHHSNDLLPLPFTIDNVRLLGDRIDEVQQYLGRPLLVENLASYCTFADSTMPEWEFISRIVERAQCGLLLDVNNLYLNAFNHGFDPAAYLAALPWERVGELHLGGYEAWDGVLIDTHGTPVQEPVWSLYRQCCPYLAPSTRVLIERDASAQALPEMLAEAARASAILTHGFDPESDANEA